MIDKVVIYTDGACRGNPGPGGWGAIIIENNIETVFENIMKKNPDLDFFENRKVRFPYSWH